METVGAFNTAGVSSQQFSFNGVAPAALPPLQAQLQATNNNNHDGFLINNRVKEFAEEHPNIASGFGMPGMTVVPLSSFPSLGGDGILRNLPMPAPGVPIPLAFPATQTAEPLEDRTGFSPFKSAPQAPAHRPTPVFSVDGLTFPRASGPSESHPSWSSLQLPQQLAPHLQPVSELSPFYSAPFMPPLVPLAAGNSAPHLAPRFDGAYSTFMPPLAAFSPQAGGIGSPDFNSRILGGGLVRYPPAFFDQGFSSTHASRTASLPPGHPMNLSALAAHFAPPVARDSKAQASSHGVDHSLSGRARGFSTSLPGSSTRELNGQADFEPKRSCSLEAGGPRRIEPALKFHPTEAGLRTTRSSSNASAARHTDEPKLGPESPPPGRQSPRSKRVISSARAAPRPQTARRPSAAAPNASAVAELLNSSSFPELPDVMVVCDVCARTGYLNFSPSRVRHYRTLDGVVVNKESRCDLCGVLMVVPDSAHGAPELLEQVPGYKPLLPKPPADAQIDGSSPRILAKVKTEYSGKSLLEMTPPFGCQNDSSKFKCLRCFQTFHRADRLLAHAFNHTGKRAFVCESCGHCFTRKHCLVEHTRSWHPFEKSELPPRTKRHTLYIPSIDSAAGSPPGPAASRAGPKKRRASYDEEDDESEDEESSPSS
eukprot:m.669880 g.669880  ORF g.669880 m.669880 type:complete len:654 (+) comp58524_c0_seq7:348-2309(+)